MLTHAMRWTYVVLAWILLAAVVTQFLFAGLFILGGGTVEFHVILGNLLFFAGLLLTLVAFAARLPWKATGLAALMTALIILQPTLAFFPIQLIRSLHPVNALAIFSLSAFLAFRARGYLVAGKAGTTSALSNTLVKGRASG